LCQKLCSQSITSGNSFIHGPKETSVFGLHHFTNGGIGTMPGIVGTKRNGPTYLSFAGNSSVSSVSDAAHVDGYVKNYSIPNFIFPIGDNGFYRPIEIAAGNLQSPINAAYFRADPDISVTSSLLGGNEVPLPTGAPFPTSSRGVGIFQVSNIEYWDINGTSPVRVTFYWNAGSQISTLTSNMLSSLRLAGWDGTRWVEIPATINGGSSLISGSITSNLAFNPDQYNVYTFAATDCVNKSLLTISELNCNGNTYNLSYLSNGANVIASAGTISGNKIINIPTGTSVTISADNGVGCLNSIEVTGPSSCSANCNIPLLSIGQAICNGPGSATYNVSFSDPTEAIQSINAGVVSGNAIINIPLGTDLILSASNSTCRISYTIKSPSSCTNPCDIPRISFSGPLCSEDLSSYYVNYITSSGSTMMTDFGNLKPGQVADIPFGIQPKVTVKYPGCPDQTLEIISPSGCMNTASIGEFVWHDLNGNGQQDSSEPGIPGIQINLFKSDGIYVSTVFTDPFGKYLFKNLNPGSYYLEFKTPAGFERTFSNRGNDNTDSDVDGSNGPGTTSATIIAEGVSNLRISAGFFKCVPIGDLVWYDINKNDIWDTNENGINGLKVNLWRNNSGTWSIFDFKLTSQKPGTPSDDGYFLFCAPPGEYYIEVIMPPLGLVRARPNVGNNEEIDSDIKVNGTSEIFQLLSGQSKTDFGAGFYPMAVAGNLVWHDVNTNGKQESSEPGVKGIKVEAVDQATGQVFRTVFTDKDGIYQMNYLEKQSYYLKFAPPLGFGATVPRASTDDLDSDVDHSNGTFTTRTFNFEPGQSNQNIDMGLASGVLPVDWLEISVIRKNDKHEVFWSTAHENNVSHYIVERKLNSEPDFTQLGTEVPAKGNSQLTLDYNYEDDDVNFLATYYYRIKQIDFDGQFTYSQTVKLEYLGQNDVSVYPNPGRNISNVQLYLQRDAMVKIELYDSSSKLVAQIKPEGLENQGKHYFPFELGEIQAGIYTIFVTIDGVQIQRKFIRIE
jgi:hypothetical protein